MLRSHFLGIVTSAAFAPSAATTTTRLGGALVLSGGGARGAYEAGWVEGLRRAGNVADGSPLPGVDVVCGASIGSMNGWFIATGQYTKLAQVWHTVASQRVFEIKHRFAAAVSPHAFIITKIVEALSLESGLTKNVRGILDGGALQRWIDRNVDPTARLVTPFVFTVTNLDRGRAELFYRLPFDPSPAARAAAIGRLRNTVSPDVPVREATEDLLGKALHASASIPILFDPVELPIAGEMTDRFVDGGIADNDPVDVGRALARNVYAILVDPANPARHPYADAVEIGLGAFGIAQARVLQASLRAAAVETAAERELARAPLDARRRRALEALLDVDLFVGRPAAELPVQVVEFDRQEKIDDAYEVGVADAARGWSPFALPPAVVDSPPPR